MRYTKVLIASALLVLFGAAVACPGDKAGSQTPSDTISKPMAPKPSV